MVKIEYQINLEREREREREREKRARERENCQMHRTMRKGHSRSTHQQRRHHRATENQGPAAQERHPETKQTKEPYGANKPNLDATLKEAMLGDGFILSDKWFQYSGTMLLIDLESEWLT